MNNIAKRGMAYKFGRSAAAQASAPKYMQILSLLYVAVVSFPQCIVGYPLFVATFTLFYWGGVTGTSLISRSLEGHWEGSRDYLYC